MRASLALATLSLLSTAARADALADAKRHFSDGVALLEHHELEGALAEFETSYRLNPLPELLINIALSQKALGRPAEAFDTLQRYLMEAHHAAPQQVADAKAILAELQRDLATLVIDAPAGSELHLDGKLVGTAPIAPLTVSVGVHELDARGAGGTAHQELWTRAGEHKTAELRLVPIAPPVPRPAPLAPTIVLRPPALQRVPAPTSWWSTPRGHVALGFGIAGLGLLGAGVATDSIVLDERDRYRA